MKNNIFPNLVSYGILFIAAFLFVFLFSCTTSPLYEHHPFWFHGDSGIFQEMGICLLQGGTPYVDLFDHKGPVLWFIQALGIWISPRWGLMALQAISLFFTMLLWFKSTHILAERQLPSIIITLSGLIFLLAFYQRGNLCEEWCLPFISLPIYLYVKRWKASTVSQTETPMYQHSDAFIMGLCVGIIAMIRLNNTAPLIGFALWHFIRCIQQKDYRRLWTDIALIVTGMAIVFIACAIFYLIKAGWTGVYEMIYGTFIFNFIYIGRNYSITLAETIPHYFIPVLFIAIVFLCHFRNKSLSSINAPVITSLVITLLSVCKFEFLHYSMIFIPLFVIILGIEFHSFKKLAFAIIFISLVPVICFGYECADLLLFRLRGKQANTELNDGFHRFVSSIPANEQKSIYNDGLNHMGAGLFADEGLYQCNRIIYGGHTVLSPRLQEYESSHGIKDLQPIWVLSQSPSPEVTGEYMKTHYTLADSIPGGEFDPIWCWKRNE